MSFTLADAVVYFRGDDSKLQADTDKTHGKVQSFVGGATKLIGGALVGAAAAAAGAVVGIGVAGVKSFIDFEGQMNEVFSLLPGISQGAMDGMTDQVKQFAKDFGVLPENVVPALYQALSAGIPQENVFEFLATANKAAVGGVAELETAVDGLTSVVNAYGADTLSVQEASDLMFTTVKLGKTDFDDLSGSLYNVIPTAASLGVKFGDVGAALAVMTAQGTPTAVATTQLRQLFVELSDAGTKTSKVFAETAGQSFVDFVASGGNVQEALTLMEQAAADNNLRLSDMFGSVEAGNAALALTGKGAAMFSSSLAEMDKSAGATDAAFQTMDSGIGKSFEKIRAAWSVAILDIGTKLAPAIQMIADFAVEQMPRFTGAITGAFDFIQNIIGAVVGFIKNLFQNDLGGSIAGAAGQFDFIKQRIDEIMPYIQTIITNVLSFVQAFWAQHGETVMAIVGNLFQYLQLTIGTTLDVLLQLIKLFLQIITGDWQGAGETLKSIVSTLWDYIKNVFSLALDSIKTLFGGIDWGELGRNILQGIANGILNGVGIIADAARSAARSAYEAAKSWLGIGSPSKKAAEGLGKPFAQGVAEGIEKEMRGVSGLNLGLQALFQGSQPQMAGAAMAGSPISITINVGGNGGAVGQDVRNGVLDALRQAGLR